MVGAEWKNIYLAPLAYCLFILLGSGLMVGVEFFKRGKGWDLSAKLGKHGAIWGKLGTALQAYALNPCTKFPPNPTSRKVNT